MRPISDQQASPGAGQREIAGLTLGDGRAFGSPRNAGRVQVGDRRATEVDVSARVDPDRVANPYRDSGTDERVATPDSHMGAGRRTAQVTDNACSVPKPGRAHALAPGARWRAGHDRGRARRHRNARAQTPAPARRSQIPHGVVIVHKRPVQQVQGPPSNLSKPATPTSFPRTWSVQKFDVLVLHSTTAGATA